MLLSEPILLKVEHISYTMGTRALPGKYTLALGPAALGQVYNYIRQSTHAHAMHIINTNNYQVLYKISNSIF